MRNVLYRALGQSPELDVDIHTHALEPETCLLLGTDGVWLRIKHEEILEILLSSRDAQHACDNLIAAANERGGYDNSTVIIISNDFPFASGG